MVIWSMISQIENIQYNASSTITGAIKETARFKLHKEIGLERLDDCLENFAPFSKLKLMVYLQTCLTLFQKAVTCIILDH